MKMSEIVAPNLNSKINTLSLRSKTPFFTEYASLYFLVSNEEEYDMRSSLYCFGLTICKQFDFAIERNCRVIICEAKNWTINIGVFRQQIASIDKRFVFLENLVNNMNNDNMA